MKIAFVLERLGNGGAERVTAALATEFCGNPDLEIHIFTFLKEENEYTLPSDVIRHNMDCQGKGRLDTLRRKIVYLKKEIAAVGPDVVISLATPKTTIMLSFFMLRRKFILIVSERNDPNKYPKEILLKLLRSLAYRISDGVVFQTSDAQAFFSMNIQNKSVIIPNPISDNLPTRWLGERKKVIVNFCRLEPQKNLKMLIAAFSNLGKGFEDYQLHIYGIGPEYEDLQKYCYQLNIENRVVFKGFSSNIHSEIIDAGLYVSSSNYEGISNSMLEAISIGIPSICTDCPIGGARMVIKNEINGILVPVGDENRLSKEIRRILSDDVLAKRLSINGEKLRDELNVKIISKKWMNFIERSMKL